MNLISVFFLFLNIDAGGLQRIIIVWYNRRTNCVTWFCTRLLSLQLFAAGLKQAGKDSDGFAGFLLPDVMDEYRRCRRLVIMIGYCVLRLLSD